MKRQTRGALSTPFAVVLLAALAFLPSAARAGAFLSKTSGLVQVRLEDEDVWHAVHVVPHDLKPGESVRTGLKAAATLQFEDGSRVELGPNASFALEEASGSRSVINMTFGALKAFVQKLGGRKFQVRTPTAVCSVRGTEFRVEVLAGGRTVVDLYKGLLGVEDHKGQQVLLHPNERLEVNLRGLGRAAGIPSQSSIQRTNFHALMQREMALDLNKEQVMAAAVNELKTAEFQQGKSLIDVSGRRVRVEQYIVRPTANQFKLVVLNERQASFNYFYYLGTFNAALPTDLSVALKQLGGTVGTAPSFWLTSFETGRSNTQDSIVEKATGGHVVDMNNNGVPADKIVSALDPATGKIVDTTNLSVFQTLFDNYGFYINGGLKYGWTGNNIQTNRGGFGALSPTAASTNDPITGALLATPVPAVHTVTSLFPSADKVHQQITETYSDGSITLWDNYVISDEGKIASFSDFNGVSAGPTFHQKLLEFNFEQVVTATEFHGRKIDLVVAPKMLIQAGLIQ